MFLAPSRHYARLGHCCTPVALIGLAALVLLAAAACGEHTTDRDVLVAL